jgi:hypothetical protein
MLTSLVLAASMVGQLAPNAGNLWNGSAYVMTTFDTSKPLHFNGGSLSMDLIWQPAMDGNGGGFASLPFLVAGVDWPVTLQFYPRVGYETGAGPNTWGLVEVSLGGGSVGDYMVEFDAGSTAGNVAGRTNWLRMWAINRAGASSFTLTQ